MHVFVYDHANTSLCAGHQPVGLREVLDDVGQPFSLRTQNKTKSNSKIDNQIQSTLHHQLKVVLHLLAQSHVQSRFFPPAKISSLPTREPFLPRQSARLFEHHQQQTPPTLERWSNHLVIGLPSLAAGRQLRALRKCLETVSLPAQRIISYFEACANNPIRVQFRRSRTRPTQGSKSSQ